MRYSHPGRIRGSVVLAHDGRGQRDMRVSGEWRLSQESSSAASHRHQLSEALNQTVTSER